MALVQCFAHPASPPQAQPQALRAVLATEDGHNWFWHWLLMDTERGSIMLFLFMPTVFHARVLNEAFKGKK